MTAPMPRFAICHAASEPARPPPMIWIGCIFLVVTENAAQVNGATLDGMADIDRWETRFGAPGYLFGTRPNAFLAPRRPSCIPAKGAFGGRGGGAQRRLARRAGSRRPVGRFLPDRARQGADFGSRPRRRASHCRSRSGGLVLAGGGVRRRRRDLRPVRKPRIAVRHLRRQAASVEARW